MKAWSLEELALLWRHSNAEVAESTGRSIEEVGDKRLQTNIERNGWDKHNPEAVTKWFGLVTSTRRIVHFWSVGKEVQLDSIA
ncbi:TPA: hypothetical protein ACI4K1_004638 [Enterobacter roggenkampii]